jgi:hypothetical protein
MCENAEEHQSPSGSTDPPLAKMHGMPLAALRQIDNVVVKAIARAFRWREMLENGTYATITEIAAAEKISETYVGRVLRLTLLAPDIVEAILGGRQPGEMTLAGMMRPLPVGWREQGAIMKPDCLQPTTRLARRY